MKVEFEKNITVMKTLSYILIASTKIYSDYSKELGINIPTKVFIIFLRTHWEFLRVENVLQLEFRKRSLFV